MTRKKVNLTYISKESSRRATFNKRKKGLLKKMSELTTLCDIDACAIIFSPYDDHPEVHPSPLGAARVLRCFQNMPENDRTKKMVDHEAFLRQCIAKASNQLAKIRRENKEKEITRLMFQGLASPGPALLGLTPAELSDLGRVIDRNLKDVGKKIERVEQRRRAVVKEEVPVEEVPRWKRKRGPRASRGDIYAAVAEERVAAVDDSAGRQESFMELMMSHQHHHENHIMNLASGENGACQWSDDRVFP